MIPAIRPPRLSDLPLWRLLVLLADTERTVGPGSSTARTLAAEITRRLRMERATKPHAGDTSPEVTHVG